MARELSRFFIFGYRVCALARKTERDREIESEKSPSGGGRATPQYLLLHSPLRILGMHAQAQGMHLSHRVIYMGIQQHSHYANCWSPHIFLIRVWGNSQEEHALTRLITGYVRAFSSLGIGLPKGPCYQSACNQQVADRKCGLE